MWLLVHLLICVGDTVGGAMTAIRIARGWMTLVPSLLGVLDFRVKAPPSWPCQHHDGQPDAVERFGDVEQVAEPIGAINWLPLTYPFEGVECKGPAQITKARTPRPRKINQLKAPSRR